MFSEASSPYFRDLVPNNAVLERVSHGHIFTEGPVWNAREGLLYFVDILGDTIWKWTPGVGESVFLRPSGKANGMTYDRAGRLVVAGWSSRNVWRMEHDGVIMPLALEYGGQKLNTPNDLVVKSDGSIYFTDATGGLSIVGMEVDDIQQYRESAAVFKLVPGTGELTLLTTEIPGCNGLAFSPDESILYVNDTGGRYIQAYDVKTDDTLTNSRRFCDVRGDQPGNPDGMKVDVSGNVYCTGPGGMHVFDPTGVFLGRILVPEPCSNMAWGDADWKTLYITARSSVFRIRLSTAGIAV